MKSDENDEPEPLIDWKNGRFLRGHENDLTQFVEILITEKVLPIGVFSLHLVVLLSRYELQDVSFFLI